MVGFHYNDGGKRRSKRKKQIRDCTVRAVAIARCMEYDDAYDELKAHGRKSSTGFPFSRYIDKQKWATRTDCNMSIEEFVTKNPRGCFILLIRGHVFAVLDGVIHDSWNPVVKNRKVLSYWRINEDL